MDGTITHINEVAAIIMGVEQHGVLGSAFDDLNSNHPHYSRIRDALRKLVKTEGLERIEVQLRVRGRDHSYLLKQVALRSSDESPFGTLLIMLDVTYLRDQSRARTSLLATLSHELRTPLTPILVSADLLNRGSLDESERELVRAVLDESARIQQLTDNLLSLARGELASIALSREHFDFSRLVAQTTARFRLQAEQKGVRLEWNLGPTAEINGDATKLSWIMSNLIGNALRCTPEGGSITILTAANGEDGLRFQVSDSGPGIPSEVQPYIFERFSQYPNGSGKSGAAGLGLAIVKEIVEAHGGRIFLESALDSEALSLWICRLPKLHGEIRLSGAPPTTP